MSWCQHAGMLWSAILGMSPTCNTACHLYAWHAGCLLTSSCTQSNWLHYMANINVSHTLHLLGQQHVRYLCVSTRLFSLQGSLSGGGWREQWKLTCIVTQQTRWKRFKKIESVLIFEKYLNYSRVKTWHCQISPSLIQVTGVTGDSLNDSHTN